LVGSAAGALVGAGVGVEQAPNTMLAIINTASTTDSFRIFFISFGMFEMMLMTRACSSVS
jgi:hypothetical protein